MNIDLFFVKKDGGAPIVVFSDVQKVNKRLQGKINKFMKICPECLEARLVQTSLGIGITGNSLDRNPLELVHELGEFFDQSIPLLDEVFTIVP